MSGCAPNRVELCVYIPECVPGPVCCYGVLGKGSPYLGGLDSVPTGNST